MDEAKYDAIMNVLTSYIDTFELDCYTKRSLAYDLLIWSLRQIHEEIRHDVAKRCITKLIKECL